MNLINHKFKNTRLVNKSKKGIENEISNDSQKKAIVEALAISEITIYKRMAPLQKLVNVANSCVKSFHGDGERKCKDSSILDFKPCNRPVIKTSEKPHDLQVEIEVYMPIVNVERNRLIPPKYDRPIFRWNGDKITKSHIPKTSTVVNNKSELALFNSKSSLALVNNKSKRKSKKRGGKLLIIDMTNGQNDISKLSQAYMQQKINAETSKKSVHFRSNNVQKKECKNLNASVEVTDSNEIVTENLKCPLKERSTKRVPKIKKIKSNIAESDLKSAVEILQAGGEKVPSSLIFKHDNNFSINHNLKANDQVINLESQSKTYEANVKKSERRFRDNSLPEGEIQRNRAQKSEPRFPNNSLKKRVHRNRTQKSERRSESNSLPKEILQLNGAQKIEQRYQNNSVPKVDMQLNRAQKSKVRTHYFPLETRRTFPKTHKESCVGKNSGKKELQTVVRHNLDGNKMTPKEWRQRVKQQQLIRRAMRGKLSQHKVSGSTRVLVQGEK
ncbi:hypothetical protein NPIL_108861 [Nephila pilipes]|uniref:Uncharacterized protein n=1 Tax=Nephila pilipes TaxID=299642 RepID=A0A8X6T033_NEPPI|nr:hypothetical protein NPIL_108861 [Nephila pilipes]